MAFDTISACRDDCGAVTIGNKAPVSRLSHHVDWDSGTDTFLRH